MNLLPKNVLFDFFEGKGTSLQRKMIEDFLSNPENEDHYYKCLDEWESQHPQAFFDTERALGELETILGGSSPQSRLSFPAGRSIARKNIWWGVAASVAILLVFGLYTFQRALEYRAYSAGYGQTRALTLPDGTMVTLNANSKLYVPRWNFMANREVLLEGEGEFRVTTTDDHKRFVVKADDGFNVEVWGTRFVFYARPRGKKVVLNEGKVQINYQSGKQLALKPGDVLSMAADDAEPSISHAPDLQRYNAWKHHRLFFDNTPLSEVAAVIRENFGLEVIIPDSSLANRRLAGYFHASSSEEILEVLSALLEVSIERQEGKAIIQKTNQIPKL